ncbi:MAG: tetraacyldisaccharide 4'-kinase [Candidatus Omnitrophica bacterium]|nr:tetraacyldisaccharide 4'-kinase [Candidatus Omnitrophota bacterium]MDD5592422.1 tetraacyldisaccharide 4'-kinase [Candidatus Omnitrophota bacterium]
MLSYLYNLATDKSKGGFSCPLKLFLYFISITYGLALSLLIFVYRLKPCRLKCRVISVGNITLGGTGKTSLVALIARYLKSKGHKVAILSRGYKRKITNCRLPITDYENLGDEPYMLKMNLKDVPVIVDADRIRSAKKAIRDYGVDTVILDDGFQQWRIKKDLEIVAIDATCPFGNRNLIPRGILREPLSSLRRADVFFLTKTNFGTANNKIKDFLSGINPRALIIESIHQPVDFYKTGTHEAIGADALQGKRIALFSGIGDPDSFENLVKGMGMEVGLVFKFRDHHNYTQQDIDNIIKSAQDKNIDTIITTEKDAVRLYSLQLTAYSLQLIVLCIKLKIIKDEERFYNRLLGLYSS